MESSHPSPGVRRSNTALPKLTTPVRSNTAQPSKRSHLSLHHHHRHSKRHEHHSHHRHVSEDVKSAVFPGSRTSLGDLVRPGHGSSKTAGNAPYSGSPSQRSDHAESTEGMAELRSRFPRPVRPEDVALERARAKQREEHLRKALQELSEHAMKATRRLDETFYGILEKVSTLHSTIDGLQELSNLTKSLHAEIGSEADELAHEIQGQIDGFAGFNTQRQMIEDFEHRIKAGKEKAATLNQRLEDARRRVDEREKAEDEWQATMSRRLRVLWAVVGVLVALFVILVAIHNVKWHYESKGRGHRHTNFSIDFDKVAIPAPLREILESVQSSTSSVSWPAAYTAPAKQDDARLRLLDEL